MKLNLKNIGKIAEASIEINTITIIAGENNTGKSTFSKTLFSLLYSLYDNKNNVFHEKNEYLFNLLASQRYSQQTVDYTILVQEIVKLYRLNKDNMVLRDKITNLLEANGYLNIPMYHEQFEDIIDLILDALRLSDIEIVEKIIENEFKSEFTNQITNLYNSDQASLVYKDETQTFTVNFNNIQQVNISDFIDSKLYPVYIDNPNILDSNKISRFNLRNRDKTDNHEDALLKRLFLNEPQNAVSSLLNQKKSESILQKISSIISGKLILTQNNECFYRETESSPSISINNLSEGIKIFVILKTLLQNNQITPNTVLILDEPETHLHPKLQVTLAELIILFQKFIGLKILLNTHSPYFLEAIEVFSAKYGLYSDIKYYLSRNDGNISFITDITHNIDAIYSLLAAPIYKLEEETNNDNK